MTKQDEKQNGERRGAEAVFEDLVGESALRAKRGGRDAVSGLTPRIRRQQQSAAAAAATEQNLSAGCFQIFPRRFWRRFNQTSGAPLRPPRRHSRAAASSASSSLALCSFDSQTGCSLLALPPTVSFVSHNMALC